MRSLRVLAQVLGVALCGCDLVFLAAHPDAGSAAEDAARDASGNVDAADRAPGCADGVREAFHDIQAFPDIAGCAGAWTVGGVQPARAPSCGRQAGNGGANPTGIDCNVSDLCAAGWDICSTREAVLARLGPYTTCVGLVTTPEVFFVTRQGGLGDGHCDTLNVNDVFGCGTLGALADVATCAPLDRVAGNACADIGGAGGWACVDPGEARTITKSDPLTGGGVLCCRERN